MSRHTLSDYRFEKSLYDLIRGLRNHKGNEREYIQNSLRECKLEIRGADMDLKATALLKLVYLEMFGHDMSWASFHVLEVMSSPKYLQKRVGYLGAVQSFRPDTEVLMLATNLVKKDINSSLPRIASLPLTTLPHIITSPLAISILSDLIPRLAHSDPTVRKKTIVTLYRLALVYPDTLRPAWPKMKDLLMDEQEDPSVTAAIINVVCELGWRRPQDFLPVAPRLFNLLLEGGNNWMAIKILKLFATLTTLEPRLVKKLLPLLTNLIRTTPAMSLLYECINSIIQGGILDGMQNMREAEEIAHLCVSKLREMILVEGDPNLRYVALLAFNRIGISHAHLVSLHEDVILSCIDDPDISIRMQALDLSARMVTYSNLIAVVERLMLQLKNAPKTVDLADTERAHTFQVEPAADSDGEDPEETLRPSRGGHDSSTALSAEYRVIIIRKIIEMCSKEGYANITDFEWYISTLLQLVKLTPTTIRVSLGQQLKYQQQVPDPQTHAEDDVACAIGSELRNVAVRVKTVRSEAVYAANVIVCADLSKPSNTSLGLCDNGALAFAVWVVGEFANYLQTAAKTLDSLIHQNVRMLPPLTLCAYLQSIPKVLALIISSDTSWNSERRSMASLLLARVLSFLEPLGAHSSLEVQERAVELAELIRVCIQALQNPDTYDNEEPYLLTKAIPSLFTGTSLNPIAPAAQRNVPFPNNLNLDTPLHPELQTLLQSSNPDTYEKSAAVDFEYIYENRLRNLEGTSASERLSALDESISSYQKLEDNRFDGEISASKRIERRTRNKDDPFYIPTDGFSSGTSTPIHEILKISNGEDIDIDTIPIIDLDLGAGASMSDLETHSKHRKVPRIFDIVTDENIENSDSATDSFETSIRKGTIKKAISVSKVGRGKKSLLEVDSSGLGSFSISGDEYGGGQSEIENHDADMVRALEEVERLRLEMQRASERTHVSEEIPPEGTLVKRKKKKRVLGKRTKGSELSAPEALTLAEENEFHVNSQDTAAATAALYATRPGKGASHDRLDRVEDSNRLSSAGAATSLKYASPADLPSYPSAGVTNIESSAETAASLANANHQVFEHWKPDTSQAASRAAKVAKDFKATELWQPPKTSTGSRAAALAAKDARSIEAWHPEATEAGNSAAGQAMRGNGLSSQARTGSTVEGHSKALLAATGAMSGRRRRSGSSPINKSTYPDSENSAANALLAASFANKSSLRSVQARKDMTSNPVSATMDPAHLKIAAVTNLTREMYTSNPPVAPEIEEKNRQAGQRAAAISMAKQMYEIQQRAITQAEEVDRSDSHVAANYLHNRKQSTNSMEESYQSPQYVNLQEAAQKLAAERLAKLHDEHAAYRNYYGTNVSPQSRLSVRNRPRRRASSDGDAHVTDSANSKQLRPEMSLITENAVQADAQKRQKDRDLLMAAAQRNVKASMQSMDEKVFAETGRPSPAMEEDWELKANARAKAASEARMVNHGKVNIGGGKYLDQSEIDEIAAKRVQPTLDEISEKAAIQRARDAELQREEQERNRVAAAKVQEEKERNLKTKVGWKRFRDEEKREAKAKKEEDRMKRIAEKQSGDDNKRLSVPQSQPGITPDDESAAVPESAVSESAPYFDAVSLEEPNEPASKVSRTEVDSMEQEHSSKSPIQEQPKSVTRETNEVDAVSEVDPTLLDPALRESVIDELSTPGKNENELSSSDPSHAKMVAARVLSAPSINDVPIEELTKAIRDATNAQENLAAGLPQPSMVTVSEESRVPRLLAVDPPNVAETRKLPHETGVSSSLLSDSSHLKEGTVLDDITTHRDLVSDSSHTSEAIVTAPKSPKGESKVTTWLKSKFGRRTAKSHEPHQESSNQARVGLEDDERHKEEQRSTSQSISSISNDEDASANVPVSRQQKLTPHADFEEAHNYPDTGESPEENTTSGTSRDLAHSHDNHARDSKFQENL